MPFRTILAITGVRDGDGDIKLAAGLSEQAGAHLSVMAVALAAPPPIGDYAAPLSDAWAEERRMDMANLDKRTQAVQGLLAAMPISSDVTSAYAEMGWSDEIIGRRARYADLTVIGPEMLSGGTLRNKAMEGALFSSGRPVLLAPAGTAPTLKPKRVMVAWDSRLEASRAVREALEILARADEVRVVLVDPVEGEYDHGEEPGADVAAYLARHGANVAVDRLPKSGQDVADVLRRHAGDMSADLLVMGAYGHSRLRERIFGGVTKSMLAAPSLPILMAR